MADETPRGDQPRIQTSQLNAGRDGAGIEYRVSSIRTSAPRANTRRLDRE
jgi:hypothetical protein